ncbi:MAG: hypothetical protein IPN29_13125 [Saprospiraceae bacterium]|nr:hypothetical protein [Saprospiraceae bacterium]
MDVSFLRSFPEVAITVNDLKVMGLDTFYGNTLLDAKALRMDFSLLPLFNKNLPRSIKYIGLQSANLDLIILNDTLTNYLITKPSKDSSMVEFKLEDYELNDCKLKYTDFTLPLEVNLANLNHKGSGDIADVVFDLNTSTTADSLTLVFDGFTYLTKVKASLDAVFHIDLDKQLFELKDNTLKVNKLTGTGDGYVQFLDDENMKLAASVKTTGNSFGDLISIFPYLSAYNTAKASGQATFTAEVNGVFNRLKSLYPAFDILIDIDNGSAVFESLNTPVKDVFADIRIKSTRPDMKDLEVDIRKLSMAVNNEKISGQLNIKNGMSDPLFKGNFLGGVNLENWTKAFPLPNLEMLKGRVDGKLDFSAKKSDIDKENYSAIVFDGQFKAANILYKAKGSPSISVASANLSASPQRVSVETGAINMGRSDAQLKGEILHPMAYFSVVKNITGKVALNSTLLDMNEWNSPSAIGATDLKPTFMPDLSAYKFSHIDADVKIDQLLFGNHVVSGMTGVGTLGLENVEVKTFRMNLDGSDLSFNGKLANVYSYFTGQGTLNGDLNVWAGSFDANKFMVKSESAAPVADSILFTVPERVNLKLNTKIDKLIYTNMELLNFTGDALVQDKTIALSGLSANTMGGKIGFDGLYSSKNTKPEFNVKLDLSKLEFVKAYEKFVTMKQLAPIAKYITGVFNTTLVMEGKLGKGMMPDFSSLTLSGFIETLSGYVKGFKPLAAVGDKLGIKELSQLELKDTRNWFDMKDGTVEVKEFTKNIAGIDLKGSGTHRVKGKMDYVFLLRIPREMMKKNVVTGTLDKGLSFLEKEAGKYGVSIGQGEFIDVKVNLGGTISSPTVSIIPVGTSGKSFKEEVNDEINDQINKAKDSLDKVIQKKKEEIKDTIRTRAEEEIEKAKGKAEEKAGEVIEQTKDKIKKEVESKVDTLVGKAVSDSLKKKAEEVLKDKSGKEIEDLKNKVKDWNPFKKKKAGGAP